MGLILRRDQQQRIFQQAIATYPEECCGLLLGTIAATGDRRQVHEVRPLANQWSPDLGVLNQADDAGAVLDRRRRYWIDPKDLLKAQRDARDRGWVILGVYHSHPDHPAEPSARDRAVAWSDYSYPILSVRAGQVVDWQSWRLQPDHSFQEEPITVIPDTDNDGNDAP
jgi:proteasome lid subunit RPN8/RPN11